MTKWLLTCAAAASVLAVTATADIGSAFAQSTSVTVGTHGVTVRERSYRHRDRGWRHHHARACRVVTTRHRTPHGHVVVRKTRQCY
jgi:hypothetical protein